MKLNNQRTRKLILPALLLVAALLGNLIVPAPQAAMMTPGAAAAMAGGEVVGWGDNSVGQMSIPAGLSGVTAIATGGFHSLALKSDGTVVGWGYKDFGEVDIPAGLSGVTAIATENVHSMALKNLSLPQQVTQVITQVQDLVKANILSGGQGAGLITKLNGGQTGAACNQLDAFIYQVNGFIGAGALSQEQGASDD